MWPAERRGVVLEGTRVRGGPLRVGVRQHLRPGVALPRLPLEHFRTMTVSADEVDDEGWADPFTWKSISDLF